ncbi:hypothetical protein [Halorubrum sp. JWXQ-INN 858]|nr:hypothetical protein [Halorubrum sp. JWXQ-INN 858]
MNEFVSPMRADVCNDRFEFSHDADCEVYRSMVESSTAIEADDD